MKGHPVLITGLISSYLQSNVWLINCFINVSMQIWLNALSSVPRLQLTNRVKHLLRYLNAIKIIKSPGHAKRIYLVDFYTGLLAIITFT